MKTPLTKLDCKLRTEQCYQMNLKPMFEKMEKMDDKIDKLSIQLASIPEDIINKTVSWTVFWAIILMLVSIISGIIGYQFYKISNLEAGRETNSQNIAILKTQNEQTIKQNDEIKQTLKEIRAELKIK